MQTKKILETHRLSLSEFGLEDANFIIELVNSPNWLKYIGDRNVKTDEDAIEYLKNGPIHSYEQYGFGLWKVLLKNTNIPIGMCGLVNRETLEDIDIGFAMLPEYSGLGYGFEIASATMQYSKQVLNLDRIVAITDPGNIASIKLLNKIGLCFEKTMKLSDDDSVLFFSESNYKNDEKEINKLTTTFFEVFTNTNRRTPRVKDIEKIFIPEGILISNTHGKPEIFKLNEFITPREKMLNDGTLIDFEEYEISSTTEIYGNVAQRFSFYQKSGVLNGVDFVGRGMKTIQFIKMNDEWKMSSVAWSDDVEE
ncbi:GNAT family N-acetyltransferase [Aquimarina sp. AU119]|uniref:GNAT family N-acetyltransferase n=1 Tax=Aquimarina sp. AU119 TaxID=2108528 RepID=UPI000D69CC4C|nr:GNAT family N-acetyltransferase [Aquimarina sp. AU119]